VMLGYRYTLGRVDAGRRPARRTGTRRSVVAVGVLPSGRLSRDRPTGDMTYDYRDASTDLVAWAQALAEV